MCIVYEKVQVINMSNYVSCSIWYVGPGRPWDNGWELRKIIIESERIEIFLDENEKMIIYNPKGVEITEKSLIVSDADEITWDMYTYGNNSVHCITNYKKVGNLIHVNDSLGKHFERINKDYAFQMKGNFINCEIIRKES